MWVRRVSGRLVFRDFGGVSRLSLPPEATAVPTRSYPTVRYGTLTCYDVEIPYRRLLDCWRTEEHEFYVIETDSGRYLIIVYHGCAELPAYIITYPISARGVVEEEYEDGVVRIRCERCGHVMFLAERRRFTYCPRCRVGLEIASP